LKYGQFNVSNPTKYQLWEEAFMARKAEVTLWAKLKIGRRCVMKRMLRRGRGFAQNIDGPYEAGSYYLRFTHNGKRIWESVGRDLTLALQEQRARHNLKFHFSHVLGDSSASPSG
jgi:hypothetical protein